MTQHARFLSSVFIVSAVFGAVYRATSINMWFATGVPDDAMYYLRPALNFATGHGSSFDGVGLSNGYHPLWFLLLAGLYKGMGPSFDPESYTVAAMGLQVLLFAGFVTGFYALVRRLASVRSLPDSQRRQAVGTPADSTLRGEPRSDSWPIAAACTAGALAFLPGRSLNLLETPAQLLIFVLFLHQLLTVLMHSAAPHGRLSWLGLSAGLFFLARTDGFLLFATGALALALSFRSARALVFYVLPCAAVLVTYWAINYAVFDTAMPVSGAVKLDENRALFHSHSLLGFVWEKLKFVFGPFGLFTPTFKLTIQLFALVPVLVLVAKQNLQRQALFYLVPGLYLTLKYLAYTLLLHGMRSEAYWYWVLDIVVWLLFAAAAISHLSAHERLRPALRSSTLVALVGLSLLATRTLVVMQLHARDTPKPKGETGVLLVLASFLRTHDYFAGKRIGSFNAGILGMFSGRQVTNLDGLINSKAYARLIETGRRDAYIQQTFPILVEYHPAYRSYYQRLGFSMFNVSRYVVDPVAADPPGSADYWIYVSAAEEARFRSFLGTL